MYYILFDKLTKKVIHKDKKEILNRPNGYEVAEYYGEIPKNDYLTVINEKQETKTWVEKKEFQKVNEDGSPILNDNGEVAIEEVKETKTRTYLTCDLVANFYPPKTEEELAKEKEKKYSDLVNDLIRKKYPQSAVEALQFNLLEEPNNEKLLAELNAFQEYRKECKAKAKQILNM